MIDTTLIKHLTLLADKEKKLKEYNSRLRIKGKIGEIKNEVTKQKNDLAGASESIKQGFSTMRLVAIIFGFLLIILYSSIIMVAVAGLGK